MYPGTIINIIDRSATPVDNTPEADGSPLFLSAASFDKGPEDMRIVSGQTFNKLYGSPSFDKHGQPAIQAAHAIENGARLLIKRVVADNSTLANVILVASVNTTITATPVTEGQTGKTINEIMGRDTSGDTPETPRYTTTSQTSVKWTAVSVANAAPTVDSPAEVKVLDAAADYFKPISLTDGAPDSDGVITITTNEGTGDYPIFVIVDNGRGVSNKSVRFSPDYNSSKTMDTFFYTAYIFEGTTQIDNPSGSIDPDAIINGINYGFKDDTSIQLKFLNVEGAYEGYVDIIATASGLTKSQVKGSDIINLKDNKKNNLPGIELDPDSINLDADYGINLQSGDNGDFGDAPFGTEAYNEQLIKFFSGEFDDAIFDLDDYKIAAVFDANYPVEVKEAIAKLVSFREDCVFFRDLGVDVKSYASIIAMESSYSTYNRYIADYLTTYQIFDPNNGKRIRVTMMYDFESAMINHFISGAYRPTAGIINSMILPSAIPGTINFTPRITPTVNQKSLLEDSRINYAIFQNGQCIVQTLYTSQEAYTQLSYVNNVLGVQEVARAVRTSCPKFRYTFATGNDLSVYAKEVSKVLANYSNNFAELGFEYTQSAIRASQKIFYASITFRFNNWAQTEIFDLYALPTTESTTTSTTA